VDLGCLPGFAGLFFYIQEGWYSEAGISKRQQFGVSPDEHHSLCEWEMQVRGTQYVVPNTWYPEFSVMRTIHGDYPTYELFVMVYLQSSVYR
jgi:hypothetical protein